MAKVTAEFTKLVWIDIRGEGGKCGQLPQDDGLVRRFFSWCENNKIFSVRLASCGPGFCCAGYWEKDAEKIGEWLESQGVECTQIVPHDNYVMTEAEAVALGKDAPRNRAKIPAKTLPKRKKQ